MFAEVQEVRQVVQSGNPGAWTKRALDIMVASGLLLMFAPLALVITALLKLTDSGSAFFVWNIVGIGGRPIRSYKFRTMVEAAETMEANLRRQGHNEMKSVYFKARHDPRVTPIGRILRRFSLDEIPSLWSVLKGDMSLVGPRPVRMAEVQYLRDWHNERFAVRPGLTSPWVICGKEKISDFDEIAALDIEYIRNWSILRDVKILARTAGYVISGRNY
jgi:lipopolysaccharide/colanic/teichoic acid biosynthesis glycosyltransferase